MSDSEFFSKAEFSFTDSFTDIRKIYSSAKGATEVYTARKALKRFALKALKPELKDEPFYVGLLRKEFEIGFRLEHPNIVHTYSFEEVEGLGYCIVLEWIEGETLAWHLSHRSLDDKAWLKVMSELCDALEYLKTRQIVHRDIKPSNLLLTYDGNHLKLIDFGFADSPEYGSLKHSGGTRGYAAPEQLSDSEIKSTSDIFALGKVLKILPIRKNKRVRNLILRMCSAHPSERPQSAVEVKENLRKATVRRRQWYIYFAILAAVVAGFFTALFFMSRSKEISPIVNEHHDNPEEVEVPSTDTVRSDIPPANKITPADENKKIIIESHPTVEIENSVSEEVDSSDVKKPKKVVHWMIALTARYTRSTAQRLRAEGDPLWEEHARAEVREWVDRQTEGMPDFRRECYDEITRNLDKIRAGAN